VLDNVDLSVSAGTFCSVVGPSGWQIDAVPLILGEEQPTSGEITIDGAAVTSPGTDRGIVYQRYSLYPNLTVLENVVLGRTLRAGFLERVKRRAEFRDEAMKYAGTRASGGARAEVSIRALRRHAAARRHRPGAHHQPQI